MTASSRQEAAAEMRTRLVDAAIEQLADDGMRGVTHRRVEQRAGVSQGLVKYHFGTLDGLIEACVERLADVELGSVMRVTPDQVAEAQETNTIPSKVWDAARNTWQAITAHPGLIRARYELFLHAARNPELQDIVRRGRARFIAAAAKSLPLAADPQAAARMVIALVDGLVLHQISAPDAVLDELGPAYLLAAGAAAQQFPFTVGQ
ncbi:TetR/AcrR family transcriptional regulator [Propionimicrobium sp. PCR01-08-3]|uniref:TetR/AcrR family transcriptional regulator n=1 Tax=Propionimicrobium sp. PCR01-08-3 TaxID=3052086 RepID=UPI00255CE530|nr:TetR/AcrR family transcriptional regulator [Propionimicrobium sp. PCR01-08-3]WIY83401.1 TetR family transcriptional regulator [Propionimicrobium sp. PCR01-08-3]